MGLPRLQGLYSPEYEHDSCGVGFVVNINGEKSHDIIKKGIEILNNLLHRGALGADKSTGDGAGLLFQIPDNFFRSEAEHLKINLPEEYGVAMCFLPMEVGKRRQCMNYAATTASEENLTLLGWREVPVIPSVLGEQARNEMPSIWQCFLKSEHLKSDDFERKLYVFRKQWEKKVLINLGPLEDFYICSCSSKTIVYKGLMQAPQVPAFYKDLNDKNIQSSLVVVHQRFSTNTFPCWKLAQPFRLLAHNGEINTIKGNRENMCSREKNLRSDKFKDDVKKLFPIIEKGGSDSASLDNVLELLNLGGREIHHSLVMMIPQGWGIKYPMGPDLRGFFDYHAGIMEPWDGPAAVAFTDGRYVGCLLDRNGLRPARYTVTYDGIMTLASETGVIEFPPENIKEKGALRPGQIILVDTLNGRIMKDTEVKMALARKQPYRRWVNENRINIRGLFDSVSPVAVELDTLRKRQKLFGYTREDEKVLLEPMALNADEPKGSMGSDQPLAIFSERPQLLFWYFKQMFAQVTNPAIDPEREELVMTLMTLIGNPDAILDETPKHARLIKLRHPILTNDDLECIMKINSDDFKAVELKAAFKAGGNGADLEKALESLCKSAEENISTGSRLIVISDYNLSENETPIPILLAVSAVHRHLLKKGMRTSIGIIARTAEAREVMHMALLLGYGASAINPYLAFETIAEMVKNNRMNKKILVVEAIENYINAICKGLLKIMSKMGISTLRSYRNAQIFEAIGLKKSLVDRYFEGTPTRIEGIGLDEIAAEANSRYFSAYHNTDPDTQDILPSGGQYKYRVDGERHLWTPKSISLLQRATRENRMDIYRQFAESINNQNENLSTIRGLFKIKFAKEPISIDEVEPATEIVKRFATGAMSFGSISRETHETLAIAMNRLKAMSNSGEGGEDSARYIPLPNGDSLCSSVKQVASGRFGVTIEYLVNARELQIKIAQGAKPGEGGHL
ncbi:MAG TPA: glutamate synthase central domain-containing protein, partial [Victivallales bacterium]|nr:glutamate synthase central domain-containing protein [Victivallales bacterium]